MRRASAKVNLHLALRNNLRDEALCRTLDGIRSGFRDSLRGTRTAWPLSRHAWAKNSSQVCFFIMARLRAATGSGTSSSASPRGFLNECTSPHGLHWTRRISSSYFEMTTLSRVSLAFRAKGFYIGSDLVDLIFKHEVHYQSPEFTTTWASNTLTATCNKSHGVAPPRSSHFVPMVVAETDLFAKNFNWLSSETSITLKSKKTWGNPGRQAWRCWVPLL